MDFKLGADPEFFVQEKATGKVISAYGLIEGTKENPIPMGNGSAQVDGMALEVNVKPATTTAEFIENKNSVINALQERLPDYNFLFIPQWDFGKEYMETVPVEAKVLGCTPDFNAYTMQANPIPDAEVTFRTAAGHIHVGWTDDMDVTDPGHLEACSMLVKYLDRSLGVFNAYYEPSNTRRSLYGAAGAFRPKKYGVEYRTLSNAWLLNDYYAGIIFETANYVFKNLIKSGFKEIAFDQTIINRIPDPLYNMTAGEKNIVTDISYNKIQWYNYGRGDLEELNKLFFRQDKIQQPIHVPPRNGGLAIDWETVLKVKEDLGDEYHTYRQRGDNSVRVYPKKQVLRYDVNHFVR